MYDVTLAHEQLFRFGADGLDYRLGQKFLFVQARDTLVQINGCCAEDVSLNIGKGLGN